MKHLEASKRIVTTDLVDPVNVKYSFVQRLRSAFHVETVGEGVESFSVTATAKTGAYGFSLTASLKSEKTRIRLMLEGQNNVRMGTKIFYVLSLLMVLILSLFQDSVEASHASGVAMNAMFFLVIGGFIIYDHNKKMEEPQEILEQILESLEVEFG